RVYSRAGRLRIRRASTMRGGVHGACGRGDRRCAGRGLAQPRTGRVRRPGPVARPPRGTSDAFRRLAEAVVSMEVDSYTRVGALAAEAYDIRAGVDGVRRGARFGPPIFRSDGSCEISAEVTVREVAGGLRDALSRSSGASGAERVSGMEHAARKI